MSRTRRMLFGLGVAAVLSGCGQREPVLKLELTAALHAESPAEVPPNGAGFAYPADKGGELLRGLLTPNERRLDAADESKSGPLLALEKLGTLTPRALPSVVELPRFTLKQNGRQLAPKSTQDETVPVMVQAAALPQATVLPAGALVRVPSRDVDQPPPLPILGQQNNDRPSLDDATADASLAAVLKAVPTGRTTPAPFVKLTVPEPFEFRAKPAVMVGDEQVPSAAVVKVPRR